MESNERPEPGARALRIQTLTGEMPKPYDKRYQRDEPPSKGYLVGRHVKISFEAPALARGNELPMDSPDSPPAFSLREKPGFFFFRRVFLSILGVAVVVQ